MFFFIVLTCQNNNKKTGKIYNNFKWKAQALITAFIENTTTIGHTKAKMYKIYK